MNKNIINMRNTEKIIEGSNNNDGVVQEMESRAQVAVTRETFSGPLPSPQILNGYEQVIQGAADRIIKMAENQMQHRHNVEDKFLNMHSRNTLLGIVFAFIMGAVICIGGIICVLNDKQVSGLLFGGVGLATVITAFLKGTNPKVERDIVDNENDEQEQ